MIHKCSSYSSVLKIKEVIKPDKCYCGNNRNDILELNTKKVSIENNIPTKILLGSVEVASEYLADIDNFPKFVDK